MIKYYIAKLVKKLHLSAIKHSIIDHRSKISDGSFLHSVRLGKYSYVGNYCTIINTEIGSFCSISDNVFIGGASHPLEWVSTSPVFHSGKNVLRKNFSKHKYKASRTTYIGNDVWIGHNVLIKGGIKIGNGSVIGFGSVVTKDVGDFEVWAGNPAKFIRYRFEEEVRNSLQESEWWNLTDEELESKATLFNDVERFINEEK